VSRNQWQNLSKFKLWELPMNWMERAWITAQNIQRRNRQHSKCKRKHRRTNLKKIETNPNCSFWKLVSLTVFQSFYVASAVVWLLLCLGEKCDWYKAVILSLLNNFSSWIANKDAQFSLWRKWTEKPCYSSFNKTKFFAVHAILAGFLKTFMLSKKNLSRQPGFRSFSQYKH